MSSVTNAKVFIKDANENWVLGEPVAGQVVKYELPDGGSVETVFIEHSANSVDKVNLTNTTVTSPSAEKIGNIWWLPKDEPFTITANAEDLPDGGLMVMVERVINATQPVDDIRFVATIQNGQIIMQGKFEQSGNYIITAARLNAGLERINAPFRLDFETMEFDAYVN